MKEEVAKTFIVCLCMSGMVPEIKWEIRRQSYHVVPLIITDHWESEQTAWSIKYVLVQSKVSSLDKMIAWNLLVYIMQQMKQWSPCSFLALRPTELPVASESIKTGKEWHGQKGKTKKGGKKIRGEWCLNLF